MESEERSFSLLSQEDWKFRRVGDRCFKFSDTLEEDVKRLDRYSRNPLRDVRKGKASRAKEIVIVGRICAAIKRGHLSRWRVVCEILLLNKYREREKERERSGWISWSEEIATW